MQLGLGCLVTGGSCTGQVRGVHLGALRSFHMGRPGSQQSLPEHLKPESNPFFSGLAQTAESLGAWEREGPGCEGKAGSK